MNSARLISPGLQDAAAPDAGQVVSKAVVRAAGRLGLSARALGGVIGLSEASVSRLKAGRLALEPDTKPFELALLLIRLYRSLDSIAGGDEAVARAWLAGANLALGAPPAERIRTVTGLVDVIAYLDARRALV